MIAHDGEIILRDNNGRAQGSRQVAWDGWMGSSTPLQLRSGRGLDLDRAHGEAGGLPGPFAPGMTPVTTDSLTAPLLRSHWSGVSGVGE